MTAVTNLIVIPAEAVIQFGGLCSPLGWYIGEKRRFRGEKIGRAAVPAKNRVTSNRSVGAVADPTFRD